MRRTFSRYTSIFVMICMLAAVFAVQPARADATIVVNSNADGTLGALDANATCDLREALYNASGNVGTYADCTAGSGTDTITFAADYTITLTAELFLGGANNDVVDGNGPGLTIIQASTCNPVTLIDSVTQTGGCTPATYRVFASGSASTVSTLKDMTIRHGNCAGACANASFNDNGGAILLYGSVTLDNVTVSDNKATDDGGAIYNVGTVTTTNGSVFSGNVSSGGDGGAIAGTSITTNGVISVAGSTFSNNEAINGGALYSGSNESGATGLTISTSTFNGNNAGGSGGAVHFGYENATVTGSTFTGNSAANEGGAIYHAGEYGQPSMIVNSTFSGNSSVNGGGAIYATLSTLNLFNNTIVDNTGGGGLYLWQGGGSLPAYMYNTLLGNNTDGDCVIEGVITLNADSYNIDSDGTCESASWQAYVLFDLEPLGNYGGSTQTYALGDRSVAINAGDNGVCSTVPVSSGSQNNVARPQGATCDVGSFELSDNTAPTIVTITRNTFIDPVNSSSVQFLVDFSESVKNVSTDDFQLSTTGVTGAAIDSVIGLSEDFLVTVNTGSGNGSIRLDIPASATITDYVGNALTAGLPYTSGETYTINKERLTNGGFNTFTKNLPKNWKAVKFAATDGKTTTKKEGAGAVKIIGSGAVKSLSQSVSLPGGQAGDSIKLSFWVKGASIPKNTKLCQAQVVLYNGTTKVSTQTIKCKTGTFNWQNKSITFAAPAAYDKVIVKFTYSKASGTVYFDGVSLLK